MFCYYLLMVCCLHCVSLTVKPLSWEIAVCSKLTYRFEDYDKNALTYCIYKKKNCCLNTTECMPHSKKGHKAPKLPVSTLLQRVLNFNFVQQKSYSLIGHGLWWSDFRFRNRKGTFPSEGLIL